MFLLFTMLSRSLWRPTRRSYVLKTLSLSLSLPHESPGHLVPSGAGGGTGGGLGGKGLTGGGVPLYETLWPRLPQQVTSPSTHPPLPPSSLPPLPTHLPFPTYSPISSPVLLTFIYLPPYLYDLPNLSSHLGYLCVCFLAPHLTCLPYLS